MTPRARLVRRAAYTAALIGLGTAAPIAAQGLRGWVGTSVRYVELRPFGTDTFAFAEAVRQANGGFTVGDQSVTCVSDVLCTALTPRDVEHAVVAHQDLGFTAWGLGVEGLSVTGLVSGRDQWSGQFAWPRSDDPVDVALAYAELTRGQVRVRLGRQQTTSGLGFASFDGVETTWVASPWLRVQGFGGRSLARGLAEPRNAALRGLEDFIPDDEAYLVGGGARVQAGTTTTLDVRYQREAWTDGHHLISERGSALLRTARLAPVNLTASLDYDFGFGRIGKAQLTADFTPRATLDLRVQLRRYTPYFELSTIWGFFDPVPYHEGELEARWRPTTSSAGWIRGAWRRYGDTETTVIGTPLEDDALRIAVGASRSWGSSVRASAEYRLELGAGSYLQGGDLGATVSLGPRVSLDARSSVFQQIGEFRLGDAIVVGGGLTARAKLSDRTSFEVGGLRYRTYERERTDADLDWSQSRLWSGLRIELGGVGGLR